MYKLQNDSISKTVISVSRLEDGASIPLDPANTDYADYLAWLAEGNTPLEADAP